jgi:hypothetical protein
MRTLETIAQTLKRGTAHPTVVLNALIELENTAGAPGLFELEYRLARLVRAMNERGETGAPLARAWLDATRAYLEIHHEVRPEVRVEPTRLHDALLGRLTVRSASPRPRATTASPVVLRF